MKTERILNDISIALLAAGITMLSVPIDCRVPCRIILVILCVLEVGNLINKLLGEKKCP